MVFKKDKIRPLYGNPKVSASELTSNAKEITTEVFVEVARMVQRHHSAAYLANVFKNSQKNKDLEAFLDTPDAALSQAQNLNLDFGGSSNAGSGR
jgi:hypothetical protein